MLIFWTFTALLIASLLIYVASLSTRRQLPEIALPPGEQLPRTPTQNAAAWALSLVTLLTLLAAAIVVIYGPAIWWEDDAVRLSFTGSLLAALIVYLGFTLHIKRLADRDDGSFDERDKVIVGRSGAGVGGAMMVTVAIWMIALTESHNDTHLVPTYFLYLMFWSCVMMNVIASLAGILLAYRRN